MGRKQQSIDFCEAWRWLNGHPAFIAKGRKAGKKREPFKAGDIWRQFVGKSKPPKWIDTRIQRFHEALDIGVVKVNPLTNKIDDDDSKNTATRVWLECGPYLDVTKEECPEQYTDYQLDYGMPSHDYKLDCGGATFEEAIIKLYRLVKKHYGDYKEKDAVR